MDVTLFYQQTFKIYSVFSQLLWRRCQRKRKETYENSNNKAGQKPQEEMTFKISCTLREKKTQTSSVFHKTRKVHPVCKAFNSSIKNQWSLTLTFDEKWVRLGIQSCHQLAASQLKVWIFLENWKDSRLIFKQRRGFNQMKRWILWGMLYKNPLGIWLLRARRNGT